MVNRAEDSHNTKPKMLLIWEKIPAEGRVITQISRMYLRGW
jgi:hypothetical protein